LRREPAVPARISGMACAHRVRVVGKVIDINSAAGTAILDDGFESTTLILGSDKIGMVKEGSIIRAFGKPQGDEMQVELLQDMGALDLGLFKKVNAQEVEDEY